MSSGLFLEDAPSGLSAAAPEFKWLSRKLHRRQRWWWCRWYAGVPVGGKAERAGRRSRVQAQHYSFFNCLLNKS